MGFFKPVGIVVALIVVGLALVSEMGKSQKTYNEYVPYRDDPNTTYLHTAIYYCPCGSGQLVDSKSVEWECVRCKTIHPASFGRYSPEE